MDCPKCGATQPDGSEECFSCGVIFARWQRLQEIAAESTLRQRMPQTAVDPPETESAPTSWLMIAGVVAICVVGLMWTMHRRSARAKVDLVSLGKAQMNALNNKRVKQELRRADEKRRLETMEYEMTGSGRKSEITPVEEPAPPETSEPVVSTGQVESMLAQCSGFTQPLTVRFPASFSWDEKYIAQAYPQVAAAEQSGLLIRYRDGSRTGYVLGKTNGLPIRKSGDEFFVDLGRRRILKVFDVTSFGPENVQGGFRWGYENSAAAEAIGMRPELARYQLVLERGVWRVVQAYTGDAVNSTSFC